jgi:hypothetical protein
VRRLDVLEGSRSGFCSKRPEVTASVLPCPVHVLATRHGSNAAGTMAASAKPNAHQNEPWNPAGHCRVVARTAVPNDPPICCTIRVALLA